LAQIGAEFPLLGWNDGELLRGVLEDEVTEGRLTEEHPEGKLILFLATVKLLCVDEQIRVGVYL
jgi:hypothetical protein